jgi:hypothetical protein
MGIVNVGVGPGGLFFEVPEVARFVAVAESAGGFTVPDPGSGISDRHIQQIHAPGLIPDSLAVIFFRTKHTGKPRFSVRLNSTPLTQQTLAESGPNSWHEIIPSRALKPQDNELTFAANGDGTVTFSDVVVFYTANELTVKKPLVLSPI